MSTFFAAKFAGPAFHLFSLPHIAALASIVLLNFYLLRYRGASEAVRSRVRWTMALILWSNEIAWHIWNFATGQWNIQTMLPLHVCSFLVWLGAYMLVSRNFRIYEFAYFMGIAGAMQALLTPDLGLYNYPHFRFLQTFISHGLIVTSAIYMTVVEGLRPTWKSILRVAVVMNLYMVVIYFVNKAIGSDYLWVNAKPATASLLDLFPGWPVYILYMEGMGIILFLLLYLPFAIRDWRAEAASPIPPEAVQS